MPAAGAAPAAGARAELGAETPAKSSLVIRALRSGAGDRTKVDAEFPAMRRTLGPACAPATSGAVAGAAGAGSSRGWGQRPSGVGAAGWVGAVAAAG